MVVNTKMLCALQANCGLTDVQLASKSGMSTTTIRRVKNKKGNVTIKTVGKIASALMCNAYDLLE